MQTINLARWNNKNSWYVSSHPAIIFFFFLVFFSTQPKLFPRCVNTLHRDHFLMLAACLNWTDFPGSVQSSYVKEAYDMEKDGESKRGKKATLILHVSDEDLLGNVHVWNVNIANRDEVKTQSSSLSVLCRTTVMIKNFCVSLVNQTHY